MQAIVLEAFGAPEMLKRRTLETPRPREHEILVRVHTAGVCGHDVLHRAGKLPGAHQLQLVRALGGRAIAVTTSPAKEAFLRSLGAHEVVVAKDGQYSAEVWRLTGKQGVDIAMENVGSTLEQSLRSLATGGIAV